MPGQQPGTLKYPQPFAGTCSTWPSAGCHRHKPLMQIRARVGVPSCHALLKSHTASTPAGSDTSTWSAATLEFALALTRSIPMIILMVQLFAAMADDFPAAV